MKNYESIEDLIYLVCRAFGGAETLNKARHEAYESRLPVEKTVGLGRFLGGELKLVWEYTPKIPKFTPRAEVTREQLSKALWNAAPHVHPNTFDSVFKDLGL